MTSSADLDELGYALISGAFDYDLCERIAAALPSSAALAVRREAGTRIDLEASPELHRLLGSASMRGVIEPMIGPNAFAVRALLFDKVPAANWKVPWHRDRTIAVRERIETDGYSPWSIKEGIHHVQPPRQVLEGMFAVRIHLDDCGEDAGPLRVIPGSHRDVELDEPASSDRATVTCFAMRGSALLMRPLLLHASSPAAHPRQRRILHVEMAVDDLLTPLRWHQRAPLL